MTGLKKKSYGNFKIMVVFAKGSDGSTQIRILKTKEQNVGGKGLEGLWENKFWVSYGFKIYKNK